jgi:hypothetical protein
MYLLLQITPPSSSTGELKVVHSITPSSSVGVQLTTIKPTPTQSTLPKLSRATGNGVFISIGVSGSLIIVLLAGAIILTSVIVCLRRRTRKPPVTTENVAYGITSADNQLKGNVECTSAAVGEGNTDARDESKVPVTDNYAYGLVQQ